MCCRTRNSGGIPNVLEITVSLDTSMSIKAVQRLRETAPLASARALNRTATTARAQMARLISQDLGIPVNQVRDQLVIAEARPDFLISKVIATGKRIPLIDLKAKGPEPSRGRGRGVTYKLRGNTTRIPNAFIAQMRSGHRGVFKRVGRGRLPIVELRGPSLPRVFTKFAHRIAALMQPVLQKNLLSEFRFYSQRKAA